MDFLIKHPILILLFFLILLPSANWWYATFVYTDAEKRGIKNKIGWGALALLFGPWAMPAYNAKTLREQTGLTGTVVGLASGERLEKTGKKGKLIWASVFLVLFLILLIRPLSYGTNLVAFLASNNADGYLYGMLGLLVMFLYSVTSAFQKGKLNPMDKPLFGAARETPDGYLVDESLTPKHRKALIFTIILLILGPILAFIFYAELNTLWHYFFPPIQF